MMTILIILLSFNLIVAQTENKEGIDFISKHNLIETVEILAGKEFEGRLSGSDGYNKAADYIAGEFEKINLKPFHGNSYFQKFTIEYNEIFPPCSLKSISADGKIKEYQLGEDYVFRGFTGSGDIKAETLFAGYGISTEEYDDYANIDVEGKVVITFRYNPEWKVENADWPEGNPRVKAKTAADHGAVGIIFISAPNEKNPRAPIGSVLHGWGEQDKYFPQLHIDLKAAKNFFDDAGYSLSQLQTIIDSTKKPFSLELKTEVEILVNTVYDEKRETQNVIGIYEGSNPELKDEFVILGAHLDHVGQQAKEIYFPGANDNASGSAAVLEIARAFSENKIETDRSILFVFFAGEESGLEGAEFLSKNLPFDTSKVVAMLNMDCVGHGDSIRLGNGKSAPLLWETSKKIDDENNNLCVDATWSGGGADATPFHKLGIPALYFVTTNSYTHLHSTTDNPETLNPELFEKITELAFLTTYEIANGHYNREDVVKK